MRSSPHVYVHRTGDDVWSPNSKEQLCEAVEVLSAQVAELRAEIARLTGRRDQIQPCRSAQ